MLLIDWDDDNTSATTVVVILIAERWFRATKLMLTLPTLLICEASIPDARI